MAKFKGVTYLKGGVDVITARSSTTGRLKLHLLRTYTMGDTYAACLANSIGSTDVSASDITTVVAAGTDCTTTYASKTMTLTGAASGTPALHYALLDTVSSEVHLVVDESSNPATLDVGGTATSAAFTDTIRQPI